MKRDEILQTAIDLTMGDRNQAYGDPKENLDRVAQLWNAYLNSSREPWELNLKAHDVAAMMVLMKLARAEVSYKPDNYIDAAAYMAIMGEVSVPVEIEDDDTLTMAYPNVTIMSPSEAENALRENPESVWVGQGAGGGCVYSVSEPVESVFFRCPKRMDVKVQVSKDHPAFRHSTEQYIKMERILSGEDEDTLTSTESGVCSTGKEPD